MNAGGQPLTHCPVCRYDLTGLPENHRCPECGFEYDETMRWWPGRKPSLWPAAILVFINSWFFLLPLIYGAPLGIFTARYFLSVLFAPALVLVITILAYRNPSFLLISDKGVFLKLPPRKLQFFFWSELWVPSPAEGFLRPPDADWNRGVYGNRLVARLARILYKDLGGPHLGRPIFQKKEHAGGMRQRVAFRLFAVLNSSEASSAHRQLYDRWIRSRDTSRPLRAESVP
jgi:hypothetical protein